MDNRYTQREFERPGYVGFFRFLGNFKDLNCFGKGEKILEAGLDPRIASAAKKGAYA